MPLIYAFGLLVFLLGCSGNNTNEQQQENPQSKGNAQPTSEQNPTSVGKTQQKKIQISPKNVANSPPQQTTILKQDAGIIEEKEETVPTQDDGLQKLQNQLNEARRNLEKDLSK